MTKAFLFDIDGTLVDSVDFHARSWQEAFRHFGREIPFDEIRSQIGKGGDQLLPVFLSEEDRRKIGEQISNYKGELYKREYLPRVRPFPRVRELFARLRQDGSRIALTSSSKKEEVEYYVGLLDVAELVDVQTSADDADKTKPHPDILEAALNKLQLEAADAVMVGDSPYDAEAAARLAMPAIGVLCGGFAEAGLRAAGCAAIYRDPADMLRDAAALPDLAPRRAA